MGDPLGTADLIGRAGELQAVERFLEQAAHGLASLLIDGEAGIGKTALVRAALDRAGSHGTRILRSAPAESEQGPHPRRPDRHPRRGRPRRSRAVARGPATRPGDRAAACRAVRPAAGPAHAVGSDGEPAPGSCHRVDPPHRDRRCPVARRRIGLDPCLCHQAPGRPAGGRAPRRARRADRTNARAGGRCPAGAARAPPCRADAAGCAAPALPGPLRPIVPAARARADRRGVRRQPVLCARDRPLARGIGDGPDAGRASRHPRDAWRADRGPDRRPAGSHPGDAPAGRRCDRADARHAPSRRPRRARGPAPGRHGGDRGDGPRIDPVRASAAGPGRHLDGEPVRAARCPRDPCPHRDVRRRASPPSGRRHRGS